MEAGLIAATLLARLVGPAEAPKGPDRTQHCMENATSDLLGVWISQSMDDRIFPLEFRVVSPALTDCAKLPGSSQTFWIVVGKGARTAPGITPLFPDPYALPGSAKAACPQFIEGGILKFRATIEGAKYACKDAR